MHVRLYLDTSTLGERLVTDEGLEQTTWTALTLNRVATTLGHSALTKKGVSHPHVGFRWAEDDGNTTVWIPQGITGLRLGDERKFVVVSWYGAGSYEHKGVRLSFCDVTDMSAVRYRHVLAVEPTENHRQYGLYQPVVRHAGGLASKGDTLYMADTNSGVRVFDTSRILCVDPDPSKDRCGIGFADGRPRAFDYRYILPQVGRYVLDQDDTKFSFCSMDWTDPDHPLLLTGNYHRPTTPKYDNPPSMLAWWNLDGTQIVGVDRTLAWGVQRAQGGASIAGYVLASRSGDNPSLVVGTEANFSGTKTSSPWPHGCEDLHFSPHSRNLWCLTEHTSDPGRFVFAVKADDYLPSGT